MAYWWPAIIGADPVQLQLVAVPIVQLAVVFAPAVRSRTVHTPLLALTPPFEALQASFTMFTPDCIRTIPPGPLPAAFALHTVEVICPALYRASVPAVEENVPAQLPEKLCPGQLLAHPLVVSDPPLPFGHTGLELCVPAAICEMLSCPCALPSGIAAHVPGAPAATFVHPAIPLAAAPELRTRSPCAHVPLVGAAEALVGICISSPRVGAAKVSVVAVG